MTTATAIMPKMKTLTDILDLLSLMRKSDNPAIRHHATQLEGPRTHGSTTKCGLRQLTIAEDDESLTPLADWKPAAVDLVEGGCEAYVLPLHGSMIVELNPREGAIAFSDFLTEMILRGDKLSARSASHGEGFELFHDSPSDDTPMPQALELIFIVGIEKWPTEGGEVGEFILKTWHPGLPLRPYDGVTIHPDTSVKLHNG